MFDLKAYLGDIADLVLDHHKYWNKTSYMIFLVSQCL